MASLSNNLISITGGTNNFDDESANDYKGLLSKSKVEDSDVFIFSRKTVGNPLYDFSTNIITYEKLSAFIVNDIVNYNDSIKIAKNWKFDGPESFINIDTNIIEESIKNPNLHDIAINVDFLKEKIIGQIDALSTEIFSNSPHLPSIIGDIITSSTLSTITAVKNIYGENTEWENISERSLIGFGKAEIGSNSNLKWGQISTEYNISEDNRLGGNNFERLTIRNIPKHSHKCRIDNCDINYDIRMSWIADTIFDETKTALNWFSNADIHWGIFGRPDEKNTGVQGIKWSFKYWNEIKDTNDSMATAYFLNAKCGQSGSYWNYEGTTYAWKSGTIYSLNANFDIKCSLSTSKITGNGDNGLYKSVFDFNTGLEFAGSKLQEKANLHNNLPPFVTKYIWKRIK